MLRPGHTTANLDLDARIVKHEKCRCSTHSAVRPFSQGLNDIDYMQNAMRKNCM